MSRDPLPDLPAEALGLPVVEALPALAAALGRKRSAVLVAPPGAGKTTLVPIHLLRSGMAGKILLVEPRRLTARAAARRMAALLCEEVGATVGWRMRLDTKVSARTRIEVVTEGVFTRQILDDPGLSGIGAVIFDEFHERSLDADFGLALAIDVATVLRDDLKLVVMSATLDGARVAALLGDAEVIESAGRAFPVRIEYRDRPGTVALEDAVAATVRDVLAAEKGSVLVFLPGQKEIARVAERLAGVLPDDATLAPLYGALDAAEQDRAVRPAPGGARKVVLATDIAETSLTIEGVRIVVDAGLKRRPAFEPATGLTRLETVRVSRASADQRAGRAGRTEPGLAIRLWRAEQTAGLEAFDRPEILATDLSGLMLDCAAWGVADPSQLALLDEPPAAAVAEAVALLGDLGALDGAGRLTQAGEAMRRLPLPPRLAHMVATADPADRLSAADLAVLLTERGLGSNDVDLDERLRRLRGGRDPRSKDAMALARRIAATGGKSTEARPAETGGWATAGSTGLLVALAFPDRVAFAQGAPGHFTLANGRGGSLDPAHPLARARALAVAEIQGPAAGGRIVAAAELDPEAVDRLLAARGAVEEAVVFVDAARAVRAFRATRFGKAVVSRVPIPVPNDARTELALADGIRRLGLARLDFGKENERLLARIRFVAGACGPPWPDCSERALAEGVRDWLLPYVPGAAAFDQITPERLRAALEGLVPGEFRGRLDELAPSHFDAPSGSRVPIRYESDQPVLSIRVQELFGLRHHPAVAGGRLPLTLELLSPAHRPIQITRDLPGFWNGSWADVRSDLRGRYPKHEWPEEPAAATATARAKPRR
ncbi:ATP-dependent helicase HrpB [Jiella sonneratiae]|uniref:ATP-dependent helicase HrpB n=1 Tax=Jiella sonneratiae TaxID=2816856 RepID=A0ABS3J861_9HYPH|nr:ATP-dependent helicase HrpB [Jiella sonneratiae]MBO0905850.1 ATP-dependent helicase HrpB [Jiella sonneratiae]